MLLGPWTASGTDLTVEKFAANLEKWHAMDAADYVYEMRRISDAAGSGVLVEILVRDSRIRDIRYQESSDYVFRNWSEDARKPEYAVGDMVDRERWPSYPTIHELFGIIAAAMAEPAASITGSFDEDYGYPAKVTINPHKLIVDDKITYVLQNFRLLSPDDS